MKYIGLKLSRIKVLWNWSLVPSPVVPAGPIMIPLSEQNRGSNNLIPRVESTIKSSW